MELIDQVEVNLPAHPAIGRAGRVLGTRELVIGGLPYEPAGLQSLQADLGKDGFGNKYAL